MIRAQAPSGAETPRIKKTEGKKKTSVAWQGSHERLVPIASERCPPGAAWHMNGAREDPKACGRMCDTTERRSALGLSRRRRTH